jgi:hypothetical protein
MRRINLFFLYFLITLPCISWASVSAVESRVFSEAQAAIGTATDYQFQEDTQPSTLNVLTADSRAFSQDGPDSWETVAFVSGSWASAASGLVTFMDSVSIAINSGPIGVNSAVGARIWTYSFSTDLDGRLELAATAQGAGGISGNVVRFDGVNHVNLDELNNTFGIDFVAGTHTIEIEFDAIGYGGTFTPSQNGLSTSTTNIAWTIAEADSDLFTLSQFLNVNLPGYGRPVALDSGLAIVGAPNSTGSAAASSTVDGQLVQTFANPNPSTAGAVATDFYALNLDAAGGRVLIGSQSEDLAATDSGAAYLFDTQSGALLQTFLHPNPIPDFGGVGFGQNFGRDVALTNSLALIGTTSREAFLFDVLSGSLLGTFSSSPGLLGFGDSVELSDEFIAIGDVKFGGSSGSVELYDTVTGGFLRSIVNPTPGSFDFFGEAIAFSGDRILIGAGQVDSAVFQNNGEAYLFDASTGQLLHTFISPVPSAAAFFGRALDINGDIVAIGASGVNEVHIFDAVSGGHLQTIVENPQFGSFGASVALLNNNLLVGTGAGGAYLYTSGQNAPPSANAGSDLAARVGDMVLLDGTGSFDDNTPTNLLVYNWTIIQQPAGSSTSLANADTAMPSFVIDVAGTYLIELVVTDEQGLVSPADEVIISSDNLAPTALAGLDQLVIAGSTVFLDGTGSTDPESDPLSYSWGLVSVPTGSAAILSAADTATANFVADLEGAYIVTLEVSDQLGPGAPDNVSITATSSEQFAVMEIVTAGGLIVDLGAGDVTTEGNQNAMTNFLAQAMSAVGKGKINTAIDKLEKAIARTDGCALRGAPDGNGPGRDWITTCASQAPIFSALNSALAALRL